MANTHLGVPAANLVLLEGIGVQDTPDPRQNTAFFRTSYLDGTYNPTSGTFGYSAPHGQALVLTEVDWQYESGIPGGNVTLRVFLSWGSGAPGDITLDRRVLESTILLGSNGGGGTSTAETTGIVAFPGVKISVDVAGSGASGLLQHVLIRGYLVATVGFQHGPGLSDK